ncbi:hypothetical protein VR7878_01541 [Vibrio ruber DSM 16370]|uniref:PoNi C-terminal domain-containing protein n=1 Tax=Vibrio ruber (strain DSM 16370 / JCM 11486 / BCRC 17186 / CECT 7878 / LMG 23124 / VR1) TaxID=1123498 RepID=A0A1R4LHJ1_VIBR1|nr:PoNe immunity protein domain-containing protein [Vibrio ruber]SJN55998.1 hypothetical protein VR7878_01541 [Vibrio ruber DSM 16370]
MSADFLSTRRDPLLEEDIYIGKKESFQKRLTHEGLRKVLTDPEKDDDHKCSVSWGFFTAYFENTILDYSAGLPLETVLNDFDETLEYYISHKNSHTNDVLKYWEPDSFQYILWLYSLSILLGKQQYLVPLSRWLTILGDVKDDPILSILLARIGIVGFPRQELLAFPKSYQHLYDAIKGDGVSPTKAERQESIKQYLRGWYKGMKDCYWYNRHKGKFPTFFGYWAFEAGMVTLLYGLDDSSYRHMLYYPKDLVDYARAKGYDQLFAAEQMEKQKHYIVLPGDESSIDGTFLCNLTNDQITLNHGERAPGPVEDENGNRIFWVSQ